jgi:mannose-6-phosphate isomerase
MTYPLVFNPILKPKIWGGRWLASLGKPIPPGEAIGESWELADLPQSISGGRSVIAKGPWKGRTLHEIIAENARAIMGDGRLSETGGFPLLIKYLDAQQNLSVQVHPDEKYAARHPEAHLKSEAWYVIHAEPGAVIYKGVKPHVKPDDFAQHIRDNRVVDDLIAIKVKPGDCHYLPSGTCHALGAGLVVAEVQTPSDTTFRVYDWGRVGPGRGLHIEQALQCIHFGQAPPEPQLPPPFQTGSIRTTSLAKTGFFELARLDFADQVKLPIELSGLPEIWMLLSGGGSMMAKNAQTTALSKGLTVLIPAGASEVVATLDRGTSILRVQLPSPLRGMLA